MKKLFLILLAAVLVFSSCQFDKKEIFEEIKGYDMVGNQSRDKPFPGNYFIYTPIIDIFTPETGGEVSFLGFDGTKIIMDSGTDKAFLLSYDLLDGKTENLSKNLGFHSSSVLFDGEDCYYIEEDGYEHILVHKNSAGETIEKIRTTTEEPEYPEDYVLPEIDFEFFRSGEKIILIKNYESGSLSTFCYNTENGEIVEHHKNSAISGHETIPINGYITYAEEKNGLYTIYSIEPENEKRERKGPSLSEKVLFSAFDGENFVWSTESGIYFKNSAGKYIQLCEKGGRFALLGRNFIFWADEDGKLKNYRIDKSREGEYYGFSGLEMVFASEDIAVFKNGGEEFEEKFVSVAIKRGEEPLEWAEAADMAPSMVAVGGFGYYCYHEDSRITPSEHQISGKITSAWCYPSTGPKKNGQSNSTEFLGSRYAFVDGELLIEEKGGKTWYLCKKGLALSE